MNTTVKAIIWVVVLGVVAWAGYALLGSQPAMPMDGAQTATSTVPAEPIKIGFMGPLSGDSAAYGEPMRNIVDIAINEINAAGGVNGAQLVPIYEDAKCDGKDATAAAQKLTSVDGVKLIIGGFCSSESLAAIPVVEAGQVALFSPASSSPDLTGKSRFFSRNYPSDATQGKILADAAYNIKKWKNVVMIQEQLDYPLGVYNAFSSTFEQLGGKKVVKEEFPTSATDFRSMISKLKAMKPDAIFVNAQTPAAAGRILKQISDLKWKTGIIVNDVVVGDMKTVEANKAVLEGALTAEFGTDVDNAKFQNLLAAYKAKYGVDMPFQSYGQTEYDAVYILRDALMAVGNDGAKIADWLKTVNNWQGASGSVTIGADGDRVGGHVLKVIKGGKVELYVMPEVAAAAPAATTTAPKQ
ncbi:MAG: ABC transporter substrate-binding protein [Candidatus Pacebacteria bacterium]|nr:ABC transporter substrate-binding protein [Candidatus Paceibacterota bacterium]